MAGAPHKQSRMELAKHLGQFVTKTIKPVVMLKQTASTVLRVCLILKDTQVFANWPNDSQQEFWNCLYSKDLAYRFSHCIILEDIGDVRARS